jgi:hypothetical protein
MIGIGQVYDYFRADELRDDSDVALVHGPREIGYVNLSEAHVNVVFTFARAAAEGLIRENEYEMLLAASRQVFYQDRTYPRIIRQARARGLRTATARKLLAWLPVGRIDQKRADALALLGTLCSDAADRSPVPPSFVFQRTTLWEDSRSHVSRNVPRRGWK